MSPSLIKDKHSFTVKEMIVIVCYNNKIINAIRQGSFAMKVNKRRSDLLKGIKGSIA